MYLSIDLADIKTKLPASYELMNGVVERLTLRLEPKCSYLSVEAWLDSSGQCVRVAVNFTFSGLHQRRSALSELPLRIFGQADGGEALVEGRFAVLLMQIEGMANPTEFVCGR